MDAGTPLALPEGLPRTASTGTRIEEIEMLRAVAVIMVFIEHIPLNLFFWRSTLGDFAINYWNGSSGVDLFFVISGFVIARNLLPRLDGLHGNAFLAETLTFLLRRFWRLQPSAWTWLLIPTVLSAAFNSTGAFQSLESNLASALTAILAVNNLRFGLMFGSGSAGATFPYWSLSLEEQFYLLLPVAALLLRRRLWVLMLGLLIYQFDAPITPAAAAMRPGAICVGVLLAMWSQHDSYSMAMPTFLARSPALRFVFVSLLVVALGAVASLLVQPLQTVCYGLIALLSGILVYTASFDAGLLMKSGVLRRGLCWIGARSYAIYLTHMTMFALTREIWARLRPPIWVATWTLAFEFAAIAIGTDTDYRRPELPVHRTARPPLRAEPAHQARCWPGGLSARCTPSRRHPKEEFARVCRLAPRRRWRAASPRSTRCAGSRS